jgi:hypothetical protein
LLVMSRRGALQVSLGDEVQTIADGASYRMVIDPAAAAAGKPVPGPTPQRRRRGAQASGSNTFLLILLGSAAAAITVGVILAVESPSAP